MQSGFSSCSVRRAALAASLLATLLLLLPSSGECYSTAGYSASTCQGNPLLQSGGLSCEVKRSILDAHNRYRQSIAMGRVSGQPSAARMLELVWDEELANMAQQWADRCVMGHDYNRDVSRFPVGQNVAATWTTRRSVSPEPDFAKQIAAWYGEVQGYHYRGASSGVTGHYTQMVWADTYLVGCGYSFFYDRSRGYTKLYVCNYGPGGNVIGASPYQTGSPSCSPSEGIMPSKRYSGLCEVRGYSQLGSSCSYSPYGAYQSLWG